VQSRSAKLVKEMLREEKTVGQLAAEYGVHSTMLYSWRDQALAGLPSLFSNQATQELARDARPPGSKNERLYTLKLDA
jgi:transposase-like protein